MKTLALEHDLPGARPEDFRPHLKAEAARVWELVQAGLIAFEVIPLVAYPGFARLFADES